MNLISCPICGCVCDTDRLEETEAEEGRAPKEESVNKKYTLDDEYGWYSCPACKNINYNFNQ